MEGLTPRLRLQAWWTRPVLAIVATIVALLGAEGVVRLLDIAPAVKPINISDQGFVYQRSANPILSFELKANYRNSAPDLFQSYERTNAHGQRDRERQLEKPQGIRRVLLLGDSVVEGTGVREHETISRQLEAMYVDGFTEVLNFGVSGYCTAAAVELLATKGLAFDPDIVVLNFVENDFNNFNAEAFRLADQQQRPTWAKNLFLRSHLFRVASLELDWFGFAAEQDPMRHNREAIGDNNVPIGLKRLAEMARREGFGVLISVWPRFENDRIVDLPTMPDDPSVLVIERLARMVGILSVRLSPFFNAELETENGSRGPRARFTIGDRLHPSAVGARIAANALHGVLGDPEFHTFQPQPPQADDIPAIELAGEFGRAVDPNYAKVFTRVGNLRHEQGDLQQAVFDYRNALAEDPRFPEAHLNLAIVLEKLRDPIAAAKHYETALDIDPDLDAAHHHWAAMLEGEGDTEAALSHYRQALRTRPGRVDSRVRLGNLLFKLKRFEESEAEYRIALKENDELADVHNNLGRIYEELNRLEEAEDRYRRALRLNPDLAAARNNLAIVLHTIGRRAEAITVLEEGVRRAPNDPTLRSNLARLRLPDARRPGGGV